MQLLLLSCSLSSSATQPLEPPDLSEIIALPEDAGASYLAYGWDGNLVWFDQNLAEIRRKHYDYAIPGEIIVFNKGLLIKSELKKNSEHSLYQLSYLSFSGKVLHEWRDLPDSIWSINAQQTPLSYFGFSDEQFQLDDNNQFVSTGILYGNNTTIMPILDGNVDDSIICSGMILSMQDYKLGSCHRTGSKAWITDEGYWNESPKLCGDYLVENNYHRPSNVRKNRKLIIRDINTGTVVSEIIRTEHPFVNDFKCDNNRLITIGEAVNIYSLPNNKPVAVKYCEGGKKAIDIAVNKEQMVCLNRDGEVHHLVDSKK